MLSKRQEAGFKAADTKGPEERHREAKMANWSRKYGIGNPDNPFSKENYTGCQCTKRRSRPSPSRKSQHIQGG
jgi:hypothetical protein